MTIRVTITKPNVFDQYGLPMVVGTTYTVDDAFGLSLITQQKASDTDLVMANPGNSPYEQTDEGFVPGLSTENTKLAAALNTAILQKYLTAAGPVQIAPGNYYYVPPLVIPSNTNLSGPYPGSVVLKQYAGTNKTLIQTDAFTNGTSTSISIAWTSGPLITVTWTAHGFVRGDYCVISGVSDSRPQYNSIVKIHSVTDADTFTAYLPRVPVASPTGTPVGWRVTRNISIRNITFDYDYANNAGTASIANVCGVFMGRVAQFTLENVTVLNGSKYAFHTGAAMDWTIKNCAGYGPESGATAGLECHKTYGPCRNGYIENLRGRTTDDGTSIQPAEDSAFTAYRWTFGDVFNITTNGVFIDSTGAQAIALTYCDDNYIADQIYYRNINGTNSGASNAQVFVINRNTNGTAGIFGEIEVDGVHGAVTAAGMRAVYIAAAGAISGRSIRIRDVDAYSDAENVYVGSNLTVDVLDIEDGTQNVGTDTKEHIYIQSGTNKKQINLRRNKSSQTAASTSNFIQLASGGPGELNIEDNVVQGATNRRTALIIMSAAGRVNFRRNKHTTSDITWTICQQAASGSYITYDGNYTDATQVCGFSSSTGSIQATVIATNNVATSNSLGFFRLNNAANTMTLTLKGGNNVLGNSAHVVIPSGTPTITNDIPELTQAITAAAAPAVNLALGNIITCATNTADVTVTFGAPTNVPSRGTRVEFVLTNGASTTTVAWNAAYIFPTAWTNTGIGNGKISTQAFISDGTKLVATGANSWY